MKVSFAVWSWAIFTGVTSTLSFADPCKDLKSEPRSSISQQKEAYCAAAESAEEAKKGHERSAKIQAGVATLCALSCSKSLTSFGLGEGYCSSAALLGVAGSVAVTRETESNMNSIVMSMEGLRQASEMDMSDWSVSYKVGSEEDKKEESGSKSKTACLTAAMATLQALMSDQAAADAEETAKKNRELAASLVPESITVDLKNIQVLGQVSAPMQGSVPGTFASTPVSPVVRKPQPPKSECSESGFDATLSCALSLESSELSSFVGTPEFKEALEKSTGMTADEFVSFGSGKSAIQAGVLKALGTARTAQLTNALNSAKTRLSSAEGPSVYAHQGRRAGGKDKDTDSDFKTLLDSILNKNNAQSAKDATKTAGRTFMFGRKPASRMGDEENRSINLFERITNRYQSRYLGRQFKVELKRFTR